MPSLKPHRSFSGPSGPVVLVVLDGVGVGRGDEADAVQVAATPVMDSLWVPETSRTLRAHGTAVGLPSDGDMGNSEVGHNALGCGVIHEQGAKLVNKAIAAGSLFDGATWGEAIERANRGGAMHFIGLLSDGNVHSHIRHLIAMLEKAAEQGAKKLFVHPLLDGRDVEATSALRYIDELEEALASIRNNASDIDARIASGGGRMLVTMDRYEADWAIVERGWKAHVHGDARPFPSARAAIETFRAEEAGIIDQFLPAFAIADENNTPIAPIKDGDSVICFNFRGDRAIEISRAFDDDDDDFDAFDRGRRPDVLYAGMMEYDGDLHIPSRYLVEPPNIADTMGEYFVGTNITQLALSETQKFGHVTYFWNGNRSGAFDDKLETYIEVGSDRVPFEQRPWMKAAEITDALIRELRENGPMFARVNYANGDMVGHTGAFDATVVAVEVLDLQLARLRAVIDELGGILIITADHGNADEMFQRDKAGRVIRDAKTGQPTVKTSHTLSPVPFLIHDPRYNGAYRVKSAENLKEAGIANVTATVTELCGFAPPLDWQQSLLDWV